MKMIKEDFKIAFGYKYPDHVISRLILSPMTSLQGREGHKDRETEVIISIDLVHREFSLQPISNQVHNLLGLLIQHPMTSVHDFLFQVRHQTLIFRRFH